MSDTPQGGWWKAKDGKWYPPETHPDRVRAATGSVAAGPPATGWWQANDGNWYPPETHPDLQAVDTPATETVATQPDEPPPLETAPPLDTAPPLEPMPGAPPAADSPAVPPLGDPGSAATPSGWGGFGTAPTAEPSSAWGAADDVTISRAELASEQDAAPFADLGAASTAATPPATTPPAAVTPPVASPAAPLDEEEGAPLPGWRRGSDGAWYPPGQELPTDAPATRSSGTAPAPGAPGGSDRSAAAATAAGAGERTSRRTLLLVAGALAAVAVLVVAGFLLLGGGDGDQDETAATSTTEEVPTTSAPTTSASTTTVATTTTAPPPEPPGQVSGTGSAVVGVGRTVTEPLLALATHDGPGAFALSFVGSDGAVVQQPMGAGVQGTYLGVLPVNFVAGQPFDAVRVEGEGPWAVTFAVVQSAPVLPTSAGQVYDGSGDAVLQVSAAADLALALSCSGCGDPLTLAAFDGSGGAGSVLAGSPETVTVPAGTEYLQVTARPTPGGPTPTWSLRPT